MLSPVLVGQLDALGLDAQRPPNRADWKRLLANLSRALEKQSPPEPDAPATRRSTDPVTNSVFSPDSHASLREPATAQLRFSDALFAPSPVGTVWLGPDHLIKRCNDRMTQIFGYAHSELCGQHENLLYADAYQWQLQLATRQATRRGTTLECEVSMRHRDYRRIWVLIHACVVDPDQPEHGWLVTYTDISARRQTEQELRQSEDRYRHLAELSADWTWEQDQQFRFTHSSRLTDPAEPMPWKTHLGLARWELPGIQLTQDQWATHRAALERHESFRDFEYAVRCSDGAIAWVSVSGDPLFNCEKRFIGYHGVTRSITARKQHELSLAQANNRFNLAIAATRQLVFDYSVCADRMTLFRASHAGGQRVEEMSLERALASTHPHDVQRIRDAVRTLICDESATLDEEAQAMRKSGAWVWRQVRGQVVEREPSGRALRIVGTSVDITARKRAQLELAQLNRELEGRVERRTSALARSEARVRAIFTEAPVGIAIIGSDMRVLEANPHQCELLGMAYEDVIGQDISQLARPDDEGQRWQLVRQLLNRDIDRFAMEQRYLRADGTQVWAHVQVARIPDQLEGKLACIVISQDISMRREADQRLRDYANQVSSLTGRLITAQEDERRQLSLDLHDDIGQILTAVRLALGSTREGGSDPATKERFVLARSVVDEAIGKVRQLSLALRPPLLDELGLVAAMRLLCEQHQRRGHESVKFQVKGDVEAVRPDLADALYRVCQEALTNVARHAHAGNVQVMLDLSTHMAELVVRDDGIGFDASAGPPAGHLGLLGMHERIKLHGGHLQFFSAPGCGTSLNVRVDRLGSRESRSDPSFSGVRVSPYSSELMIPRRIE